VKRELPDLESGTNLRRSPLPLARIVSS
jgi:hypothetical protein